MRDIPNRQPQLDALYRTFFAEPEPNGNGHRKQTSPELTDDQVIELARRAKNATKFASLFDDANFSEYSSHSEADLALLGILGFYSQDADQLDRLFRKSALMRDKWDRDDYARRTIDYALDGLTETYHRAENVSSSSDSYSVSDDDDTSDEIPGLVCFANQPAPDPVEFVLSKIIPRGYVTNIHGAGGFGKSVLAMLAALSVSGYQKKFLDLPVRTHGKVLYLDSELDQRGQHPRVKEICKGLDIPIPDGLHYLSALGLDTATAFKRALKACKKLDITLLVIDSWGPFMDGNMESAKDVIRFYNNYLKPFVDLGVTVLIVDHQARTQEGQNYQRKGAFGSVYKENLARSVLQIERVNENRDDGTLRIRIRHKKSNFGPRLEPFDLTIKFVTGKITATRAAITEADKATEETLSARERVLAALVKGPATAKELVSDTGLVMGTVRNALSELVPGEVHTADLDGRTKLYGLPDDIKKHIENPSSSPFIPRESNDDYRSEGEEQAKISEDFG